LHRSDETRSSPYDRTVSQRPGDPFDPALGGLSGDVPLLRELQRVLFSGTGPINWELARQIGIASASWGSDDPAPGPSEQAAFADAVRIAELAVTDLTGLPAPSAMAQVLTVRRAQWVESNTRSLRDFLDPVGAKIAAVLRDTQAEQLGRLGLGGEDEASAPMPFGLPGMPPAAEGAEGMQMLGALMDRMVPLMLGAQVGVVLGYLGQRVMGQFDLPFPREDGTLLFVASNVAAFERDWSLEPMELRQLVAIHEVTHRFAFARPWVRDHFLSLLTDVVEHAEMDLSRFEQGMEGLDVSDPEALTRAFEGVGNVFGEASSDEQRLRVARVQAFVAAAEAFGDHVVETLGKRMLSSYARIDEALRRRREERHSDEAMRRLVGLEIGEERYRHADAFCRRVVDQTDEATLSTMWDGPDALPSTPELEEPTLWLSRIA
jgi:putative hydrolase